MHFIGITGGVGAGKSAILKYLSERDDTAVVLADDLARELMRKGTAVYRQITDTFGEISVCGADGELDRKLLSGKVFSDPKNREKINAIVHPAVKDEILRLRAEYEKEGFSFFFLEAALLIEEGYQKICDELWYVYTSVDTRRARLKETRGYTDERIDAILASQLSEEEYRENCSRVIDNNGTKEDAIRAVADFIEELLSAEETGGSEGVKEIDMAVAEDEKKDYVFGLDIGTRNVVGTVGYKDGKDFNVVAQYSIEHESRAMLDGQIHDIGRVSKTIGVVKEQLEAQIGVALTEVCIAAAGRVLRTVTTRVEHEYEEETVVTGEDLNTLDLLGVDQAQRELLSNNEKYKFYCVGYTIMKYYLNGERFSNLEGHKAKKIEEIIIVTFLPEDVVDGLYTAVERVGLKVANLTLEPIAAINVAIPENFRMLNIALVDVGAGTYDICVTKDGSITAYGMIPYAGDELTEVLVQAYLVDFATAEMIKKESTEAKEITYSDIMGIEHTVTAEEVWALTDPVMEKITTDVAAKIKELNGDQSVAATFVVGGGGKVHGFCEALASKLEILPERVALRGEEVMKEIHFAQKEIKKDPLLVTPVGICLNFYEQKNNFIMIHLNGEFMKLYDNGHLKIVDAAIQAGFASEELFPQRGKELNFTVNGKPRMVRGSGGESALVKMNGHVFGLNDRLEPNADVVIERSTVGEGAILRIDQLEEYNNAYVTFIVNGQRVTCPKFVEVNGNLEPGSYEIREGDVVETRSFYTVGQLAAFMDVEVDMNHDIIVNNRSSDMETLIYENFAIEWTVTGYGLRDGTYRPEGIANVDDDLMTEEPEEENEGRTEEPEAEDEGRTEEPEEDDAVELMNNEITELKEAAEQAEHEAGFGTAGKASDADKAEADDDSSDEGSAPAAEDDASDKTEDHTAEDNASDKTEDHTAAGEVAENTAEGESEAESENAQSVTQKRHFKIREEPESMVGKIPSGMKVTTLGDSGDEGSVSKYIGVGYSNTVPQAHFVGADRADTPFVKEQKTPASFKLHVTANGRKVELTGKREYIFVDIFNVIDFDVNASDGRQVETTINGTHCEYATPLHEGDTVEIFWKEA